MIGATNYPSALDTATELLRALDDAATELTAPVGPSDTTLPVASTARFPAGGVVSVGGERVTYAGKTATSFTGCGRGAFQADGGSAAAFHVAGAKSVLVAPSASSSGDPPRSRIPFRIACLRRSR